MKLKGANRPFASLNGAKMHFSRVTVKYIHTRTSSSASREIIVQMKSRMKRVAGGVYRHIFPLFPVFNRRKWHSTSVSVSRFQ